MPALHDPRDLVVRGRKRCSPFHATDLEFVLRRRLGAGTLILAGASTTSCVRCAGFEATNRDFRVVIAADAVDSRTARRRTASRCGMAATIGWPLSGAEILKALRADGPGQGESTSTGHRSARDR